MYDKRCRYVLKWKGVRDVFPRLKRCRRGCGLQETKNYIGRITRPSPDFLTNVNKRVSCHVIKGIIVFCPYVRFTSSSCKLILYN